MAQMETVFRRASSRSCRPSRKYCDTEFRTESTSDSELDRAAKGPYKGQMDPFFSEVGNGLSLKPQRHPCFRRLYPRDLIILLCTPQSALLLFRSLRRSTKVHVKDER